MLMITGALVSSASAVGWWPMFGHDPAHTSYSSSPLPETLLKKMLYPTTLRASGPVIADGYLFFHTTTSPYMTNCVDAVTGDIIWSVPYGGGQNVPAVDNGKVYVSNSDPKGLFCLDSSDGSELWNYPTVDAAPHSPVIDNGNVYFNAGKKLICLDASSGDEQWVRDYQPLGGSGWLSIPAVAYGKVYVGGFNYPSDQQEIIHCLDAIDGSEIWNYTITTSGSISSSDSLTIANGNVYCSVSAFVYCLDATGDGDGTTELIWYESLLGRPGDTPTFALDMVFVAARATTGGERLFCFDANNGDDLWTNEIGGAVTPAIAGEQIVAIDYDNNVYIFDVYTGAPTQYVCMLWN